MDLHTQPQSERYSVTTQVYEGPLDLLLQLIERAEFDITELALAQVTDQFLGYIQKLQEKSAEEVSAFLVIASRLMQIKSEALLPRPPEREPGEEDPGQALIQQLVVYKRYKEIAGILEQRGREGLHSFLRQAKPPRVEAKLDLTGVSVKDLRLAARLAFKQAGEKQPLGNVVTIPKVSVRDKIKLIASRLRQGGKATFQALLGKRRTRVEVVITFLALLELIKRYHVSVKQESLFSEIEIERAEAWSDEEDFELEFSD